MDSTFHPLGWTSASRQQTETEDKEVKCRHGETDGGWMRRIHAGAHCSLREHGTIVCFYSTLLSLLCWVMKPCVEFSFCSVGRWTAGRSPDYVLPLRLLTVGRYLLFFPLKVSLDITHKHLCITQELQSTPAEQLTRPDWSPVLKFSVWFSHLRLVFIFNPAWRDAVGCSTKTRQTRLVTSHRSQNRTEHEVSLEVDLPPTFCCKFIPKTKTVLQLLRNL